jgi:nicotinamide-nucleotide amidase
MKTAILSIGDELLTGAVVDTNAAAISAALFGSGFRVERRLTVRDDEAEITAALQGLAERHDIVVATGGLGPTSDDVTARAAAKATDRRLILNDEALAHLRSVVPDERLRGLNEKQALLPHKCRVIPNPVGTACGFWLTHEGTLFLFLPGVPREMDRMLADTVVPLLRERFPGEERLRRRRFTLLGIEEAEVNELLKDIPQPRRGVTLAYRARFPFVEVTVRGEGEAAELFNRAQTETLKKLSDHVVAMDDETPEENVARLLRESGFTLSLAESCTGGLIAKLITDIPGSSAYFREGAVTYANEAKTRALGVPAPLIDEKGAVSSEVAMAMARGIRAASGSDLAVAVTGVAGPGGTPEKPAGTVFIALADRNGCRSKRYLFPGDRDQIRTATAYTALDWLRRRLTP